MTIRPKILNLIFYSLESQSMEKSIEVICFQLQEDFFLVRGVLLKLVLNFVLREIAFQMCSAIVNNQFVFLSCIDSDIFPDVMKENIIIKLCR